MKANELQIGDWVSYKNHVGLVSSLTTNGVCVDFNNSFVGADDSEITPILLTEEILEANGFYKGSYVGGYLHRDFVFRVYPVNSDFSATSFVQEDSPIYETVFYCCYVHELQHALRLCSLNDLADSFKVE